MEYKFAINILIHIDFTIFSKIDNRPVLLVEVDGYTFHANNKVQLEQQIIMINNILLTPVTNVAGVLFCKLKGKYSILWNIVIIFVKICESLLCNIF